MKKEDKQILIDECLCSDACQSCCHNLIREESGTTKKNENIKNLKAKAIKEIDKCDKLVEKNDDLVCIEKTGEDKIGENKKYI